MINAGQLEKFLTENNVTYPLRIDRAQHPEIFDDLNAVRKGSGDFAIVPQTDLKATLTCSLPDEQNSIALDLTNDGPFSLTLGQGPFPISVGVHIKSKDGTMLLWDSGYRIPTNSTVKPGEKKRLVFDLKNYSAASQYLGDPANSLQFELVQDGNAWFSNVSCSSSH
ncbi:hypothetical protein D3C78_1474520 [compost metagenome]